MRWCVWALVVVCSLLPAHGDTTYAALITGDILALDPEDLSSTLFVRTQTCWYDIAMAWDGRLYGSDAYSLYRIDPESGQVSLVGAFGTFVNGMTFVGDTLYASGFSGLYRVNLLSGQAELVGSTGWESAGDLQWFREALYLTATASPSDWLVRVDPLTGQATLVGDIGFPGVYGLAATTSELYGLTASGDWLRIDVSTGAGTRVGWAGGAVYGAASAPLPSQIPEPGTLLLLGSGLSLVGMRGRRDRQSARRVRSNGRAYGL